MSEILQARMELLSIMLYCVTYSQYAGYVMHSEFLSFYKQQALSQHIAFRP